MGIRDAIETVTGLELPEMTVLPAHHGLDHVVEHPEAAGDRHVDGAPDDGLDVIEADPQAGDGLLHHAASLVGSAAQFQGMSSSQREAGQSAAIRATTSAI